MIRRIAVAILTTLLCSCASLKVQVAVLNPKVVSQLADSERIEKSLPELVTESDADIKARFDSVKNNHYRVYATAANTYQLEADKQKDGTPEKAQLNAAVSSHAKFPVKVSQFYGASLKKMQENTHSLQMVWAKLTVEADPEKQQVFRKQILLLLDEREYLARRFEEFIDQDIADVQAAFDETLDSSSSLKVAGMKSMIRQASATAQSVKVEIMDSGGFEHSPYAYLVASADKDYWEPRYNDTIARGMFGNTDIAIKALGPVNFTIKGLSFNPADVAATAAKVTTQAVLLASQIAGVPVSRSSYTSGDGASLALSSGELRNLMSANSRQDVLLQSHRDALESLAFAILRERGSIVSDSVDQRREALDAVIAVYGSHSARIRIPVDTKESEQ